MPEVRRAEKLNVDAAEVLQQLLVVVARQLPFNPSGSSLWELLLSQPGDLHVSDMEEMINSLYNSPWLAEGRPSYNEGTYLTKPNLNKNSIKVDDNLEKESLKELLDDDEGPTKMETLTAEGDFQYPVIIKEGWWPKIPIYSDPRLTNFSIFS